MGVRDEQYEGGYILIEDASMSRDRVKVELHMASSFCSFVILAVKYLYLELPAGNWEAW